MWTPPDNPDPMEIRWELEADPVAGDYENRLAKHLWFHRNALRLRPSLAGVRLSYALDSWRKLADVYPPALDALRLIRTEAVTRLLDTQRHRHDFIDFKAINRALGENENTVAMFEWLHEHAPDLASEVYDVAEPALVKAMRYELCGHFVTLERGIKEIERLREAREYYLRERPRNWEQILEFVETGQAHSFRTLVALLVVNGRNAEAEQLGEAALTLRDDPAFRTELSAALKGDVPAPRR